MKNNTLHKQCYERYDIAIYVVILLFLTTKSNIYTMWLLSLVIIVWYIISHKGKIVKPTIPGGICVYGILGLGILLGLEGICLRGFGLWPFFRDLIRSTAFPLFGIALLTVVSRYPLANRATFYRTVFVFCAVSSLIDLIIAMPERIANFHASFAQFVEIYSSDKSMIAVGFVLSVLNPLENKESYVNKKIDVALKIAIVINFALSFSRTAIVTVICMVVPFLLKRFKAIAKTMAVIGVAALLLSSAFPNVTNTFFEKTVRSLTEINADQVWTAKNISNNWRGYEIYCEQLDFQNENIWHQMFGKGFGSTIDVHGYAYLVTGEGDLPYLHNGYYTMLMKAGVLGVGLNLLFYIFNFWKTSISVVHAFDRKFILGSLISMVISTWVGGGIFIGYAIPLFATTLLWLPRIERNICRENRQ